MKRYIMALLLIAPLMHAQSYTLPTARQIPWKAGVDLWNGGVLPTYTSSTCTGLTANGTTDQTSAIQACITAAATNTSILIPSNSSSCYFINGTLRLKSNVELRGAGKQGAGNGGTTLCGGATGEVTTQNFSFSGGNLFPAVSFATFPTMCSLAGSPAKGDTTVTLGTVTGGCVLSVGSWIKIAGNDDPNQMTATGGDGKCDWCGDATGFYVQQQPVQVTSFASGSGGSGSVANISRPLYFTPDTTSRVVPGPGGSGTVTEPAGAKYNVITFPTQKAGFRDFKFIQQGDNGGGQILLLQGCLFCWVSDVETQNTGSSSGSAHIEVDFSYGVTIQNSYMHDGRSSASGANYAAYFQFANGDHKVERNIMRHNRHGLVNQGGNMGTVWIGNYIDDNFTDDLTYLGSARTSHGAQPYGNLLENNVMSHLAADDCWGSSAFFVLNRNSFWGGETGVGVPSFPPNNGFAAIDLYTVQPDYSFVNNILGRTGLQKTWSGATLQTFAPFSGSGVVYSAGGASGGTGGCGANGGSVPSSSTTALYHGNYDLKTNGVGVETDGTNYTFDTSMYYGTGGTSGQPVPIATVTGNSLTYTETSPGIGMDVTGGNISGTGGHAFMNAAEACWATVLSSANDGTVPDACTFSVSSLTQVATPTASPVAGTYHGAKTITLSTTTPSAAICYTTTGATPTTDGNGNCTGLTQTYTTPFLVDISLTVQAVGTLSGDADSSILTAAYVITHTTWYIRPDGGTKTQCTGLVNAAYPGTGSAQPCAVSHPYWMMNNVPGWTSFIGGDTMQFVNTTGTSDTYFTGEQNAGVGFDWNANGLSVPCAPPNPGQANGAACVMPQVPSGTVNAHTKMYGQSVGACHDPNHTHLVNPTILSGIAGAFSIINLRGASYVDVSCFGLTQPDTCTTVGNGTGKCGNLSNFVHFGGIVMNYLTGPGPSNITITDVAAAGIGSQGILGSNMSGANIFTDVYVVGNGGAGLSGDGGGCGTSCESTGTWGLDYNKYVWNGCVAVNYDFTKPYDQNSYNFCMAQQEGSFANGDGFVQIAAGTGFVLTVNHSDFSNNVQDGFDALHLSDDLTTNPAINISNSIAAHNMGQTFKIGAGASSTAINNVAVGDCRALTVDSNYPLNPSGWSAGNQIVGDACRASGGNWVFSLKAGTQITIQNNTTIGYATTTYGAGCISGTTCITGVPHAVGIFQNNTTYALADPGNSGQFASGWFFSNGNPFAQVGGAATFNNWFQMRTGCPDASLSDTNFLCGNPGFAVATVNANQTVITIDPNINPTSLIYHAGTTIGGITSSYNGVARPPFSMGAFEPAINAITTHTTLGTKHSIGTTTMQ